MAHSASPVKHNLPNTTQKITVYPNPATKSVFFTFPASAETIIKIMDVTGRGMDKQVVNYISATSFNVSGYTPGIYMYQVITDGRTQTGKILVGK